MTDPSVFTCLLLELVADIPTINDDFAMVA